MVNIKGFTQFGLGDTTNLPGMVIPLTGSASLSLPVFAIPIISAKVTLPSRIVYTHLLLRLPPTLTLAGTEAVLRCFMAFGMANLTAILASKIKPWIIVTCVYPTPINRLPLVATLIRAIRMLASLNLRSLAGKFFATYFTSHTRSIA